MRVSDVGEFGLIELLSRELGVTYPPAATPKPRAGLLVDLGDDALVTEHLQGSLILTTDTMVEGVHFLPGRGSWSDVGWKALASNISDIAAMGGQPHLALVTLVLPPETEVESLLCLYRGLKECADAYGVLLGGGDIVRGPTLSVTVSLSGWASIGPDGKTTALARNTARPGDLVAVTGSLGDAAAGLKLLLDNVSGGEAEAQLLSAHNRPRPRVEAGRAAVAAGVRCGMDVSDGLVQDLGHIARASGVMIRVDAARVPLSRELRQTYPSQALEMGLAGGEDYELVLVGPPAIMTALLSRADLHLTQIGEVVVSDEPAVVVVDAGGQELKLARGGWDHMAAGHAGDSQEGA
jgi:thiamine-monophosphate kinase